MNRTILSIAVMLSAIFISAVAAPRSKEQAKAIAERHAAKLGIVSAQPRMKATRTATSSGQDASPLYYVFDNGGDRGFTIVSGDDRMPEIAGYATSGSYAEEQLPPNFAAFMASWQTTAEAVARGDEEALRLVAEAESARTAKAVKPLLGETQWSQEEPYNRLCPKYSDGKQSVTGCVATAMAQIMMYHRWPDRLKADIPSYRTGTYFVDMPEIKSGEEYDWDNMLPTYASGYTDAQAEAVAKLMYHCGAAVHMDYGPSSGANAYPANFATWFGYDKNLISMVYRQSFNLRQWNEMIDNELAAGRPIYYAGQSTDVGHAFVCDGSDGQGLYHINWGWNGYQNGYFDISVLNPEKGGTGSGSASDGYNREMSMIIGITPDNGIADEPLVRQSWLKLRQPRNNDYLQIETPSRNDASGNFTGYVSLEYENRSENDFDGYVAIGLKDGNTLIPISEKWKVSLQGMTYKGYYIGQNSLHFDYPIPEGTHLLRPVYSHDGQTWEEMGGNETLAFIVTATATTLSRTERTLTFEVVSEPTLLLNQKNTLKVKITNDTDYEDARDIRVCYSTLPDDWGSDIALIYAVTPAHGSIEREVTLKPYQDGTGYVWITDYHHNALAGGIPVVVEEAAPPVLSYASIESNASDDYETENALYYDGTPLKVRKVYGDRLTCTFAIHNGGGTYTSDFYLRAYGVASNKYAEQPVTLRLEGGKTTYYTGSVAATSVGDKFVCCYLDKDQSDGHTVDVSRLPENRLYLADGSQNYYSMRPEDTYAYITGTASGIASAETVGLSVTGGKGIITIASDRHTEAAVYDMGGRKVTTISVETGSKSSVRLAPGIYIAGGKKVAVF